MEPPPQQCVADADIIIDLYTGDLLEILPRLSFRILVPNLIVEHELLEPAGEDLLERGWVEAWDFPGEELIEIQRLWRDYPSLTLYDTSALFLAISLRIPLLARDKGLGRAAGQHGVTILDTFWLLEEMLQQRLVRPSRIVLAFSLMEARGNFLPHVVND